LFTHYTRILIDVGLSTALAKSLVTAPASSIYQLGDINHVRRLQSTQYLRFNNEAALFEAMYQLIPIRKTRVFAHIEKLVYGFAKTGVSSDMSHHAVRIYSLQTPTSFNPI
jgi:hypothetical protein